MSYSVKKLAVIAGVSSRTLRFYDEIGLLKPAYYGENNYRYYEEEQFFRLQQILFFRELEFSLTDIKEIIDSPDFDQIKTLKAHKMLLNEKLKKTDSLITTIDKTILHLLGEEKMHTIAEIYGGFQSKMEKLSQDFLQEYKKSVLAEGLMSLEDLEEIDKAQQELKKWEMDDFVKHADVGEVLLTKIAAAIDTKHEPDSMEVQMLVEEHYKWYTAVGGNINKKSYYNTICVSSLNDQKMQEYYNKYHPKLMEYLFIAIKFFAENKI